MAEASQIIDEKNYLNYLDKPLVREGNTICYGNMTDKAILMLEIMSVKKTDKGELPDKVFVQVVDPKDPNKIINQGSKDSLYDAFCIGMIWLERALK